MYPESLLPRPHYRVIEISDLPSDTVFLRKCTRAVDNLSTQELIPALFGEQGRIGLFGMSVCLCGHFGGDDFRYRVIDPAGKLNRSWRPRHPCPLPEEVQYELQDVPAVAAMTLSWWHNRSFGRAHGEKPNQYTQELSGTCRVIHAPTAANFWHFELSFHDSSENEISRDPPSRWKKRLTSFVLTSSLSEMARASALQNANAVECKPLSKAVYTSAK